MMSSDAAQRRVGTDGSAAALAINERVPSPVPPSLARRWLREPLVQFLLIGAALFAGYGALHPNPDLGVQPERIVLTDDDLRQMTVAWVAQGRPAPTAEQMQSLVQHRVREEILYREAIALGLDKGDTIVKRRLAQKMEFLAEDVSAVAEPRPDELRSWFAQHGARFALPPRASFRHLYFSFDRRGARTRDEAARALPALAGMRGDWPGAAALADPFMFQDHYGERSFEHLAKEFGPRFAQALFELTPGSWRGPIESGYGWHLVWVDSITPGRVPALEEVEPEVKSEWKAEQRAETRRRAFDALRARYEVVLPGAVKPHAAGAGAPPARKSP